MKKRPPLPLLASSSSHPAMALNNEAEILASMQLEVGQIVSSLNTQVSIRRGSERPEV